MQIKLQCLKKASTLTSTYHKYIVFVYCYQHWLEVTFLILKNLTIVAFTLFPISLYKLINEMLFFN